MEAIQQLLARALEGQYDDDSQWDAVRELQRIGSRAVFDIAAEWCDSPNSLQRARGADIIAQLGKTREHPSHSFPAESLKVISKMLEKETEIRPLISGISALGHIHVASAVPLIAKYEANANPEIRFAVACALASYPNDPRAVEVLLKLTADQDHHVRDWATFGLGVLGNADSVEIRQALVARLSDTNADAREEAVVALAKRQDQRVLPFLIELLKRREPSSRVLEAASFMLGVKQTAQELTPCEYMMALEDTFLACPSNG
jgi:HEAT repeat protein